MNSLERAIWNAFKKCTDIDEQNIIIELVRELGLKELEIQLIKLALIPNE